MLEKEWPSVPHDGRIIISVGAHANFTEELTNAVDAFVLLMMLWYVVTIQVAIMANMKFMHIGMWTKTMAFVTL